MQAIDCESIHTEYADLPRGPSERGRSAGQTCSPVRQIGSFLSDPRKRIERIYVYERNTRQGSQIAGHDAASFTTDPGQTAGKTDVAIVLQQKLAADSLEDDVAALLDIEQGILDLFLGKRLASYSGEALCRTAEQLGYDLPALKEKLEFLGIVTLTLDLLDD